MDRVHVCRFCKDIDGRVHYAARHWAHGRCLLAHWGWQRAIFELKWCPLRQLISEAMFAAHMGKPYEPAA